MMMRFAGSMVDVVALVLRMLHIVFAVAWMGSVAYSVGVLQVGRPSVIMDDSM